MADNTGVQSEDVGKPVCGIVMPISELDGCSESHWSDVDEIISDAIQEAGFEPNLVSNADEVGLIHKRIIQNLYENPVVVCDVSGKNPNVMFELGLRLAFDKPTIIVKDDRTSYSFDTAGIEHIMYPRDLRFGQIVQFKKTLAEKVASTYRASTSDPDYTTFLKHFGEFKVAKLDKKEVSTQEFLLDELRQIRAALPTTQPVRTQAERITERKRLSLCMGGFSDDAVAEAAEKVKQQPNVKEVVVRPFQNHNHLYVTAEDGNMVSQEKLRAIVGRRPRPKPHAQSTTGPS